MRGQGKTKAMVMSVPEGEVPVFVVSGGPMKSYLNSMLYKLRHDLAKTAKIYEYDQPDGHRVMQMNRGWDRPIYVDHAVEASDTFWLDLGIENTRRRT